MEHHFGEIGLGLQDTYRSKLFRIGALSAIVRIDDAVHICVFDIGFLLLAVACEIRGKLISHVALVFLCLLRGFAHAFEDVSLDFLDCFVRRGEVVLFFLEHGIGRVLGVLRSGCDIMQFGACHGGSFPFS